MHPQFAIRRFSVHRIVWEGSITPSPLSEKYEVRIEYDFNRRPVVKIVSPGLRLLPDSTQLPHTYEGDVLCLYYPKRGEWKAELPIADYIVPWISMWLYFYEVWLATGEWLGGGTEHNPRVCSKVRADK